LGIQNLLEIEQICIIIKANAICFCTGIQENQGFKVPRIVLKFNSCLYKSHSCVYKSHSCVLFSHSCVSLSHSWVLKSHSYVSKSHSYVSKSHSACRNLTLRVESALCLCTSHFCELKSHLNYTIRMSEHHTMRVNIILCVLT
jgi:hypothetical protein